MYEFKTVFMLNSFSFVATRQQIISHNLAVLSRYEWNNSDIDDHTYQKKLKVLYYKMHVMSNKLEALQIR